MIGIALKAIRIAIRPPMIGSACSQPVVRITIAATIAPTDPARSASTCRIAPATLRLSPEPGERTLKAITLTIAPSVATASMPAPATSSGFSSRPTASQRIQTETTARRTPLASAARISARCQPNERCGVGGRLASPIATSARTSEKLSESMWTASASSASEPVSRPPIDLDDHEREGQREGDPERLAIGLTAASVAVIVAVSVSVRVSHDLCPL